MSATLAPPTLKTGRFVWRDLQTSDPERAKAFYTELFGWTVKPMGMGDFTYDMLANGDKDFGGMMPLDPASGVPPHWVSYVHVPSVDESVDAAARFGGTGLRPADRHSGYRALCDRRQPAGGGHRAVHRRRTIRTTGRPRCRCRRWAT